MAGREEYRALFGDVRENAGRGYRAYLQSTWVLLDFVHAIYPHLQRSARVAERVWAPRTASPNPPKAAMSPSFNSSAPAEHFGFPSYRLPYRREDAPRSPAAADSPCDMLSPFRASASTSLPPVSPYGPHPTKASGSGRPNRAHCGPVPKHAFRLLARRARRCRYGIQRRPTHPGQ